MFCGHLDYFYKPPLGGRHDIKPETMALQTLTTGNLLYFIMIKDPLEYIEIHCNNIWLRAWSHMTSHYT